MSASSLPGTSGLAASKSATGSSTPHSRRGPSNAPRSEAGKKERRPIPKGAGRRLNFWGAADLIAEGDHAVGRWEGGGTHTGPAFRDFLMGSLPAASGRKMRFTGTTVLPVENGKIVEEIGLDDRVTALQQLGIFKAA